MVHWREALRRFTLSCPTNACLALETIRLLAHCLSACDKSISGLAGRFLSLSTRGPGRALDSAWRTIRISLLITRAGSRLQNRLHAGTGKEGTSMGQQQPPHLASSTSKCTRVSVGFSCAAQPATIPEAGSEKGADTGTLRGSTCMN